MSERVPVRPDLTDVEPYGAPQLDIRVRLNTNETPYPPPPEYLEQLGKRIAALDLHRYPDRRVWALRSALAERFGLTPERVWAASGSNEVLQQLFQAYGGPKRRVLLFRPGYSMHAPLATVALTPTVEVDLDDDFRLTPQLATAAVSEHDPDIVCVASPNNPTGMSVERDAIEALHDRSRGLVVVDEAYAEFGAGSVADLVEALPRLVICRTFSKAWRLAGVRLGYLLAHDWVVDDLRRVRLPYHLDALAQEAGLLALELADEVTAHVTAVVEGREWLARELGSLPDVDVFPSDANFVLFRTHVPELFERLVDRGVLIRDFSSLPRLGGCLRVTVGTPEENEMFVHALKECLA